MKEIIEINIDEIEVSDKETISFEDTFIEKVMELGIMEIESLLAEDVKIIGRLEKYKFLALLRDIFFEYKKMGDTKLIIEEGTCGICGEYRLRIKNSSLKPIKKVIEMRGNNSNEKFHFAVFNEPHEMLNFKICNGFIESNGAKSDTYAKYTKMTQFALERQAQLSGYR